MINDWMAEGYTLRNERRDFVEWHRGRSPYVFWALDVDLPEVRLRQVQAAALMRDFLLEGYVRQPHVTLDLCGFPALSPAASDEFSADLLEKQWRAMQAAALSPFEITLGDLNSFSSAAYLEVSDGGEIAALRGCLAGPAGHRLEGRFVPHVTVGLYADAWPAQAVLERLQSYAAVEPLCCRIERVSLMSYQPAEIAGPLTCLADYSLERATLDWHSLPASQAFISDSILENSLS